LEPRQRRKYLPRSKNRPAVEATPNKIAVIQYR